jgi:hypothetical protein
MKKMTHILLAMFCFIAPLYAEVTFDGSDGVKQLLDTKCKSCHGYASNIKNCTGKYPNVVLNGYDQATNWYNITSLDTEWKTAKNCIEYIVDKVDITTPTYGHHMPSGCDTNSDKCLTENERSLLKSWSDSSDRPLWRAPTLESEGLTYLLGGSARVYSNVLANGTYANVRYKVSTSPSLTSPKSYPNPLSSYEMGTGGGLTTYSLGATFTDLSCVTKYYYQTEYWGYNYASQTETSHLFGSVRSFTTSPCTAPKIEVGNEVTFTLNEDTIGYFGINATDDDTGSLSWSLYPGSNTVNGVLDFSQNNVTYQPKVAIIKYTPNPGFHGTDQFMATVTDDTGLSSAVTVNLVINSVIDGVRAGGDAYIVSADSSGDFLDILNNDVDLDLVDGELPQLDIVSVTPPSAGGTATFSRRQLWYTPSSGFMGIETFDYTVRNANGGLGTATVMVTVQ